MTDAYLAGLDLLASIGIEQDQLRNRAAEVAPDFVKLAISFSYGTLFNRPELDLKTRVAVAVTAAVASRAPIETLIEAVATALNCGWSREEIVEMIAQTGLHAGLPVALKALADCHHLLANPANGGQCCETGISETGQL